MPLQPGQVVVLDTDFTPSSVVAGLLLGSRFTHAALAVGAGLLLNTYPATDAVIVREETLLAGRSYAVLDLPGLTAVDRAGLFRHALSLVGSEYWGSPCSRLTALAFAKAGFPLFADRAWRFRHCWVTPSDLLTRSRLTVVSTHIEPLV